MKRGTVRHPKLLRLARRLQCEPYAALGLLEALLDWAYQFARRGDVGRFTDGDLAEAVGWKGTPSELVSALLDTHWLDPCGVHRLLIHDLAEHADRTWKQALDRAHESFLSPQCVLTESSVCPQTLTLTPPARPEPEPEPDLRRSSLSVAANTRARTAPRPRATQWPDDFTLTLDRAEVGRELGVDVTVEWNKFKDHALKDGVTHKNWDAAWRYWCRRVPEFQRRKTWGS
jgi:hypothetical protein